MELPLKILVVKTTLSIDRRYDLARYDTNDFPQ